MNNDKNNKEDEERPTTALFDALVLRYNMSHKVAAESLSLPRALENGVPAVAFTTTRWNRLLQQRCPTTSENKDDDARDDVAITSADCIEFALRHPAVEAVLHSARDEDELREALSPLLHRRLSAGFGLADDDEYNALRAHGMDEAMWNEDDSFDEYPEEFENIIEVIKGAPRPII